MKKGLTKNISLLLAALLVSFFAWGANLAYAGVLVYLEDTLSDSRSSTVANHTFEFDTDGASTFAAGETIIIDFVDGDGFDTSALAASDALDYDIETPIGTEQTIVANGGCGAADAIEITTVNTTTDTITFTACGSYTAGAAGETFKIEIGTNATAGGTGNSQIINATSTGSKSVSVDTSDDDAKDLLLAITSGVTVTATVDETLTVTINGVAAGAACDDNGGTPTEISTTATTVPFGTVATEAFYNGCQRIDVDTNASSGYTTTVRQTQLLTSGANTIAEGSCDGTCSDTTLGGWETATNNGFGYCADDRTGNAAADAGIAAADQCDDATPLYYTFFTAPTEPTVDFMFSSGPISGDQTNISYHLSADGAQAAGAYTNVMVYVVTATF